MEKKNRILIDLEFTGLPRYGYMPEIWQCKMKNLTNKKTICKNFNTNGLGFIPEFYGRKEIKDEPFFTKEIFESMLVEIGANIDNSIFYGFSIDIDRKLLANHGIELYYKDIQWHLRTKSKYEYLMAMGGCSLEACYYIVTGNNASGVSHDGLEELELIHTLYTAAFRGRPKDNNFLKYYPFGELAGMPLKDFVREYERRVVGYVKYNRNFLADTLEYLLENEGIYIDY